MQMDAAESTTPTSSTTFQQHSSSTRSSVTPSNGSRALRMDHVKMSSPGQKSPTSGALAEGNQASGLLSQM
ncbi:unnamed protein product, partial [Anisakis simplex]|uniref:WNK1 n=1 Tax=Anisakis simplex TaxID=6269 RepID=A0A0M3KFG4_ANISI